MSEPKEQGDLPESGVVETSDYVVRPLTAHEQRIERDTTEILQMLRGLHARREAEENERRLLRDSVSGLRDRVDRLAERIGVLPTRSELDVLRVEMARLGESLSGLRHALGETNRQLEQHREHTLEQYDRLGGEIRQLRLVSHGNGAVHDTDPAPPREDAE